jgi:hypothetical protein
VVRNWGCAGSRLRRTPPGNSLSALFLLTDGPRRDSKQWGALVLQRGRPSLFCGPLPCAACPVRPAPAQAGGRGRPVGCPWVWVWGDWRGARVVRGRSALLLGWRVWGGLTCFRIARAGFSHQPEPTRRRAAIRARQRKATQRDTKPENPSGSGRWGRSAVGSRERSPPAPRGLGVTRSASAAFLRW